MSDISRRIANLSPEKRALFEKRLLQGGLASAGAQAIPRRTDAGPWPLSFTQQRLWFLAQLQPGLVAYNEMLPLHVKGPLDVAALAKAVSAMTRRHEVLRTVYTQNAGEPAQVVLEAVEVPLQIIDVSDRPAGERFEAATLAVGRESGRQIEFSKGPFFRPLVVRIDEREHIVAFLIHHIIYDGWSRGVILAELSALYSAFSRGETPALGELPLQYADFAVWQQQWLLGDSLAEQFAYWQQQLAGAPVVEMPSDRPRPPVQTYSGDRVSFAIAQSLVDRASASAREHNATLFMTVMAAWKALIHRYTGLERVVVGTPIANRTRVELEPLIGFFANTLAIPTDLSGDPTFAELLRRERSAALGAFQNQDAPFEKLVERLHPERDPAHSPVCQVMLAMQNAPLPAPNLAGLEARLIDIGRAIAKFDLTLNIERGEAGLECQLEYNSDIFDRSTAARIARHFAALLESATASPATEISRLDMMSDDEPSTIAKWNSTARDYPRDSRVDQVFDLRAAASPDAMALVSEEASITYGALRASANRLANRLRAMGVREGSLVGIALERSPEMIIGMLATLKAGGAYIPLDPSYPRERIAFMISDARPAVLITTAALEERLRPAGVAVLRLDADKGAIAAESAEAPESSATAESPAYVMFTSGSTGRPKGTVIPHRGIVRLVVNTDCAQMTPSDVVAQVSNSSFDASTWEIYSALLNGARLVIITKDLLLSPRDFAAEVKRRGVTALFLTTSLFNHFAREMPDAFCGIDWVLFGGEAADASCVRAVLAAGPPKRLVNAYGPTESTTFSSWHEVAAVAERAVSVPIGRAIANTTQYVLDRHMELAPIGVPGEIWVGGDGLAIEYLNRPDLTAERFVASPLGPGRLYRTGDVGRLLESGDIEFLGRADTQVKIRGFRIELGEVEAAVAAHPLVKEVAAICREDSPGDKRLVAYFVPRDGHPDAAAIRSFLRERLPDYMMPSAFIELANLPINPNGKVDRRVLAHKSMAPSAGAGAEPDGFVAPHTPVESVLARIWSEVIGVPHVGVRDNFFDLGGHSLLAVRLFARIEKAFGRRLPLTVLFEAPTVERLAAMLGGDRPLETFPPLVAIEKGSPGRLPLFCIATADAFIYASLARRLGPEQPLFGLHPQGIIPVSSASLDINDLASRYVEEMRAAQPHGPYCLIGVCAAGVVAFEMARQLKDAGEEVGALAFLDTYGIWGFTRVTHLAARNVARVLRRARSHLANLLKPESGTRAEYVRLRLNRLLRKLRGQPLPPLAAPKPRRVDEAYWMAFNGAYLKAMGRYRPRPYQGKGVFFFAEDTSDIRYVDTRELWQAFMREGSEVHYLPGKHMEVLFEKQADIIAKVMARHIGEAQKRFEERGG